MSMSTMKFQSTLPARGATQRSRAVLLAMSRFQSTLPARGATRSARCRRNRQHNISIHAPRTGSDNQSACRAARPLHFNPRSPHGERPRADVLSGVGTVISIHAPRTGSDPPTSGSGASRSLFQSTLPARGATIWRYAHTRKRYFNPRSPHGERPHETAFTKLAYKFQSTLPARGATQILMQQDVALLFQSTLPARGATWLSRQSNRHEDISIHAPRTGSDCNPSDKVHTM